MKLTKERTTKMNKIKYITCDREAGNVIDESAPLVTDCRSQRAE